MTVTNAGPFPSDALDANRAGELTDAQRVWLTAVARRVGKNGRGNAGIMMIVAVIAVVGAQRAIRVGPASSAALAIVAAIVLLAVAAISIARSLTAGRPLKRDLAHPQVRSIEGAIGKQLGSYIGRYSRRPHYIDVGDERFQVSKDTYDAAPDAGFVRVYYLPLSRRIVNLERVADRQFPGGVSPEDLIRSVGAAVGADRRRQMNELRADVAGLKQFAESAFAPTPLPAPSERDPRPLGESILGSWSNGLMTVTFASDGSVTARLVNGFERNGRWSVDASGRLHADVTGQEQAAAAWVTGDRLVIDAGGAGISFTRARGA